MLKDQIDNLGSSSGLALILGYGLTGKALADFFEDQKIAYVICDDKNTVSRTGNFFRGVTSLDDVAVKSQIKMVFPSPGIALMHPWCLWAHDARIPVVGELELASFYLSGDFIAVTGTNGKSTTVMLINALLKDAGAAVGLYGNIGAPLIAAVREPTRSCYVVEESSYQLELVGGLKHRVAVCLNVTSDHLDRYKNLEEYAAAKARIFKNSSPDDFFIFNYDDGFCLRMSWQSKARNIPLSLVHCFVEGAFVEEDDMMIRFDDKEFRFPLADCSLKGLHNVENMLASLAAVLVYKNDEASVASYRGTLKNFRGLPHRVEKFFSAGGIDFYDDSKGTNVGAVVMALAGFEKNVILIAGGRDKQGDYAPLQGLIKGKVKKLILLGEAKNAMEKSLQGTTEIKLVDDMRAAVREAMVSAESGDTVLLSPACSSFDQYHNYEERGRDFQNCVRELHREFVKEVTG